MRYDDDFTPTSRSDDRARRATGQSDYVPRRTARNSNPDYAARSRRSLDSMRGAHNAPSGGARNSSGRSSTPRRPSSYDRGDYRRPSSRPRRYSRRRRSHATRNAALALVAVLALVLTPIAINNGLLSGIFDHSSPTDMPFDDVFAEPTAAPTADPLATLAPTPEPTEAPTPEPTEVPGRVLDPNKKAIALTFDDGPSKYTDQILDVLEQVDGRATFFVVGERLDNQSERLKREYDMGCQIGMHTYSHANLTKISKSEMLKEISRTNELIVKYTGEESHLVRPPYGSVNSTVKETIDLPLINWSLDTRDWESRNADSVYNEIMNNVVDGDILLMHDLYESTAEAVKRVVPELVAQGYQLCTVDELFELKGIQLHSGTVFRSAKQSSDS